MGTHELAAFKKIIARFTDLRIMVIGDLILDEFIWGTVSRISPEAPVPVVWAQRESFMPGGACNVANNITSLGGKTYPVGLIGDDARGSILRTELESKAIDTSGILVDTSRKTTVKTRVVAHHQQVVRIDKEDVVPVKGALLAEMLRRIKDRMQGIDAVILEDYGKGVVTPQLLKEVIPLARRLKRIVAVDPKQQNFPYYKRVSLITPNISEAQKASGIEIKDDASLFRAGERIMRKLECKILLVTLGESGMCVFRKGSRPRLIPTVAQEVFDVSGAGDTVIAAYTLALAAGADPIRAAHVANCAAGIVVGKVGTATVMPEELIARMAVEHDREKGR